MYGNTPDDSTPWQRREAIREAHEWRRLFIRIGDIHATIGLAWTEHGRHMRKPHFERKGFSRMLIASDMYRRAGLVPLAELCERLANIWLHKEQDRNMEPSK